tara:strand:+ start:278 stop:811 length:534 start_codon:yes stop_codon:yes gene_type:complete
MRDEPINPDGVALPKMIVPRVCVGLILLMWVAAGLSKVRDISDFVNTVEQHNVLPQELFGLMWWVGPGELVLGLMLVFVMGSELTKFFGRAVLLLSMSAIIAFSYYLWLVDDAVLLATGCGCLKAIDRIHTGMDGDVRTVRMVINGTLVLLHLIALFGPGSIMRAHRKKLAAAEADA